MILNNFHLTFTTMMNRNFFQIKTFLFGVIFIVLDNLLIKYMPLDHSAFKINYQSS